MSFKIRNLSINNRIGDAVNRFDHKIILVPKLQHVIIAALILHVKMPFPLAPGFMLPTTLELAVTYA
jgi:hypothetical protein